MTAIHFKTQIAAGFLPLLDAAPLIVAHAKGFAKAEGLDLRIFKELSWAAVRDRISIGHIDAAHMPAPLPIATTLGLGSLAVELQVPMALATGGNAVTVSQTMWELMKEAGAPINAGDPVTCGAALKRVLDMRKDIEEPRLIFGVVHPFSSHNYELRHWLSAAGILPEADVQLVILPPPYMADALEAGRIDGYCVGEPWNSLAQQRGSGRLITTKARLWPGALEKVLAMRDDAPEAVAQRLVAAIAQAAEWCDAPSHREELASLLAEKDHMNLSSEILLPGLSGTLVLGDGPAALEQDFLRFGGAANVPFPDQAVWLYAQMVRWSQTSFNKADAARAASVYRPQIWQTATGQAMPAKSKLRTFDGQSFEPQQVESWLARTGA